MADELRDWDIVSGVGITALAVAAGRAVDTSREDGLIRDPFAAAFVRAANSPVPMPTRAAEVTVDGELWDRMSQFMGLRSKFFDEYFEAAWTAGARQAVILAAGLDCRAFRLDWPDGSTVFEIDQPRVLEFKDSVLAEQDARPACARQVVAVDLRDDWASALERAGFDPGRPTAWLAEGLMPYLPDGAASRLLDTIHRLSAPGSTVAVEHVKDVLTMLDDPAVSGAADEFGIDIAALFAGGSDQDPGEYVSALGWAVAETSSGELGERYGRPLDGALGAAFANNGRYLTGSLEA